MTFEELSQELRKARLEKKWRPRDIARRTRIQYEYIKLIESGDFTFMPETIIRGYIKSYSRDVGLNQNEMIEKFEQAKSQTQEERLSPKPESIKSKEKKEEKIVEKKVVKPKEAEPAKKNNRQKEKIEEPKVQKNEIVKVEEDNKKEKKLPTITPIETKKTVIDEKPPTPTIDEFKISAPEEHVEPEKIPERKKSKKIKAAVDNSPKENLRNFDKFFQKFRGELILAGLLLIVIIAIVLLYLKFGTEYFSKDEAPVNKISVFEAREQNLENETEKKVEEEQIRVPDTVRLRILAAEETWVRMVSDSTETSEFIFKPGETRTFEAKYQMELKMGRADGLFIWVNEDSIGKLGTAGEIVGKLVIGPQGIITKEVRAPQPSRPAKKDTTVILLP